MLMGRKVTNSHPGGDGDDGSGDDDPFADLAAGPKRKRQDQDPNVRFYANQIGWNQLMTLYQSGQGWAEQDQLETTGSAKAAGHRWHWQLQSKPTIGAELIRYQLLVAPHAEHEPVARPVLYMSATP